MIILRLILSPFLAIAFFAFLILASFFLSIFLTMLFAIGIVSIDDIAEAIMADV